MTLTKMNMTEAEAHAQFEESVGGTHRAEQLQRIWNNSFRLGTEYDRLFKTGAFKTRTDVFISKASQEGFSFQQIQMFLNLP